MHVEYERTRPEGVLRPPVMPNDRAQNGSRKVRIQELHHYLAKLIGLVGVISPTGSFSAIAERQTPLPA
jgi:hypothetical protein